MAFARIEDAIEAVARGEIVVVVDDPDRENEGDFLMAADLVTPEAVNFMITHGRGLLCTPMTPGRLEELALRQMAPSSDSPRGTAFTVSVDLADGGTGISAPDRAACIRRLVDPAATADDFRAPGHVFPLRARPGGVLERRGHTEAAVDLARLAGRAPAGAICEIVNPDGTMARLPDLEAVAERHGLLLVTIADLVAYRLRTERHIRLTAEAELPTPYGTFRARSYESSVDSIEHLALVLGSPEGKSGVLVRPHAECLLGDVFGAGTCPCGALLREAMRVVGAHGEGVVVYVRDGGDCRPQGVVDHPVVASVLDDLKLRAPRFLAEGAPIPVGA